MHRFCDWTFHFTLFIHESVRLFQLEHELSAHTACAVAYRESWYRKALLLVDETRIYHEFCCLTLIPLKVAETTNITVP